METSPPVEVRDTEQGLCTGVLDMKLDLHREVRDAEEATQAKNLEKCGSTRPEEPRKRCGFFKLMSKEQEWFKRHQRRMLECHNNHQGDMDSDGSWSKKLRMSGVIEEQLQQLNIDYPLSEHSRSLCRDGPEFEDPFYDDDATNDEKAQVDSNLESMVMMERIQR
ncbi:hypothetical protein HAX54_018822 [Datura stramonium]|uniref:Uncharacterized protein n=1 Tax=Datura stramonium TaxID=4076 RepID=A0ABS8UQE3_DATST|nr:hypothetical protein [Datura stramonium]